ncbi:O-acetylhomoserine aminocarboxypropyltransferase [Zavarzinia sp. CC-PAN008]|uniref:O-acetylhomoserine aminocarboxypropyltransferase n=1 Tax=Zavarzinia sp. CC-PAN008 TaxID=3243332 RepID=UPI003F743308
MSQKFETRTIHAGAAPDPTTKARITPIYQTSSYVFDDTADAAALFALQKFGNIYTRIMNPTNAVLEGRIADLEGGTAALAVGSGHAAQFLVFHALMQPGNTILAAKKLYGGSINQIGLSFKQFGWNVTWVDTDDLAALDAAFDDSVRAVFIESLANPGGIVSDIEGIAKIAHAHGVPLIVDNTLATPYLVRPLEWGADVVVHSATKFLGGHGNSIGGLIVDGGSFDWSTGGKFPLLSEPNPSYNGLKLYETFGGITLAIATRVLGLRDLGPALAPMNAFLILTGMETLALRMERHVANAQKVAEHLSRHPKVGWVSYAGLPSSPYHQLAQKYLPRGAGAVLTFGVKGGYAAGKALVERVKLFSHLANVGDVRSLVIHPASTTHSQLAPEQRAAAGAGDDVVRISIGIEAVEDIIADLDQALAAT